MSMPAITISIAHVVIDNVTQAHSYLQRRSTLIQNNFADFDFSHY